MIAVWNAKKNFYEYFNAYILIIEKSIFLECFCRAFFHYLLLIYQFHFLTRLIKKFNEKIFLKNFNVKANFLYSFRKKGSGKLISVMRYVYEKGLEYDMKEK